MDSNSDCESGMEFINILFSQGLTFHRFSERNPFFLSFLRDRVMWNGNGIELIQDEWKESQTSPNLTQCQNNLWFMVFCRNINLSLWTSWTD